MHFSFLAIVVTLTASMSVSAITCTNLPFPCYSTWADCCPGTTCQPVAGQGISLCK
ncbi:hypothetical protein BDR06DRAFT_949579 [Suillus hirtellus]|nr:hypothetical protein BDR06DRAFT_949579 [Suillus hirtellus]